DEHVVPLLHFLEIEVVAPLDGLAQGLARGIAVGPRRRGQQAETELAGSLPTGHDSTSARRTSSSGARSRARTDGSEPTDSRTATMSGLTCASDARTILRRLENAAFANSTARSA